MDECGAWMRGVGGICDRCMCLAWVERGVSGLGFGSTNPVGIGGVFDVSLFWLRWCGWCRWVVGRGLGPGSGGVVLCLCESGLSA